MVLWFCPGIYIYIYIYYICVYIYTILYKFPMEYINVRITVKCLIIGDGRNGDNSLVVSMELNGIMYQGVLFAQHDTRTVTYSSSSNSKPSRSIVS